MPERPLVLDTHVWVWAVGGRREEMAEAAVAEIEAAGRDGEVFVPAIAVWEVAMLEAKGRLSLARPVEDWVRAALRAPGLRLLDLTPEIATASTRLPGSPPADPADRMIIASARAVGGRLATRDRAIVAYGSTGHVAALDVARA